MKIVKRKRGGQLKQFCKYGHDTFITGRDSSHHCNVCASDIEKLYYINNRDKFTEYNNRTREQRLEKLKKYYLLNQEKIIARVTAYIKDHPENSIKYQTNRNLRIVAWTDFDNIKEFYLNKPTDLTVDHIIPLQGKKVSGLHVSWNLQYLTHPENSKKHNKCNLQEASEWYGKILQKAGLK